MTADKNVYIDACLMLDVQYKEQARIMQAQRMENPDVFYHMDYFNLTVKANEACIDAIKQLPVEGEHHEA